MSRNSRSSLSVDKDGLVSYGGSSLFYLYRRPSCEVYYEMEWLIVNGLVMALIALAGSRYESKS